MSFTICSNIFETAEFLQVSLKPDNQWLTERGLRGVRLGSVILRLDWVQYDGRMEERKGNDVSDLSTVFAVVVIVVSHFSVVVEDIAGSQSTLITDSDRKAASR